MYGLRVALIAEPDARTLRQKLKVLGDVGDAVGIEIVSCIFVVVGTHAGEHLLMAIQREIPCTSEHFVLEKTREPATSLCQFVLGTGSGDRPLGHRPAALPWAQRKLWVGHWLVQRTEIGGHFEFECA